MADTGFQSRQRSQSAFLGSAAIGVDTANRVVLALPSQVGEIHRAVVISGADIADSLGVNPRSVEMRRYDQAGLTPPDQTVWMHNWVNDYTGVNWNYPVGYPVLRAGVPVVMHKEPAQYRRFKTHHFVVVGSQSYDSVLAVAVTNIQTVAYMVFGFYDLTEA